MGKEIVYCEICGDRILEQEFQKGHAITLLNKNYCATCKEEAIRNIGIDEVAQDMPPAPPARSGSTGVMKAVKPPSPPHGSPAPAHGAHHGHAHAAHKQKGATGMHRAAAAPPRSHTPVIAGAVVGGLVLVIILFVVVGGDGKTETPAAPPPPPSTAADKKKKDDPKPPTPVDPRAAEAVTKLRTMTDLGAEPQQILDEVKKALPLVSGTALEADVRKFEAKAQQRLTNATRLKEIDRALADLAAMPGRDPEFMKYDDAVKLIDQALNAVRELSDPDVQKQREEQVAAAQKVYRDKYEQAAYEQYEAIYNLADTLGREGNPTQAKKVIEKFPVQYRKSQRWASLQSMYDRFSAMERKPDPKPEPQPEPKPESKPEPQPGKVDDYPSIDPPVVGQWVAVFDGKSMDKWHRIVQTEEKDGNWTVKDGVMTGVSSLAPRDGVQSAQDFLVLKYPAVTDFEMEWSMKVEGAGGLVGGRLVIQAPNAFCGLSEARNTEWKKYKMRFEGRTMTTFMDGTALPISNTETMPDAGRVFFSVYPGAKMFVKDVRFQRLK